MSSALFAGLDLLSSAVVLVDARFCVCHLNPAAENLFAVALRQVRQRPLTTLFDAAANLNHALTTALDSGWSYASQDLVVERNGDDPLHLDCVATPVDAGEARLLLEFRLLDHQLRAAQEERTALEAQANRELIRNLAHEIKNPLGGIRGSAQLLERELEHASGSAANLREYTQVIIEEADRLQNLMQRLLSSHRSMQPTPLCCHEITERVKSLIAAEYPQVTLYRDYDPSLPDITGDREQLIQAVLNIARNAAQALNTFGAITLRTRALRQITLAKRRHRLVVELQIIDNGPGIPPELRDKIFYPLVSGRPEGSGLGLTLAQGIIQQHHGVIEVESRPGRTVFSIRLPLSARKDLA